MAIFRQKDCNNAFKTPAQLAATFFAANLRGAALVWLKRAKQWAAVAALCFAMGCSQVNPSVQLLELPDRPTGSEVRMLSGDISEVAPPAVFLDLASIASSLQPQVAIAYPSPNQTLSETKFTAKIELRGLSIYKDEKTQLGPHLKVILDNQPAQDIYTLDAPVEFSELLPGSHTLRAFAVLPWGESFKNTAAYAQTTFHVLAPTAENTPNPSLPLLTYSEPQGTFGAQPVLLDFYLNNAPLHMVAAESAEDTIQDWQIRCTVNGQTFLFDQWQPAYLKGLKPGQNWVQLSLIDKQGQSIDNAFNSTVRLINYDPEIKDTLSKLVRGELPIEQIGQIVVPDYQPPAEPLPIPAPIEDTTRAEDTIRTADPQQDTNEPLEATDPADSLDETDIEDNQYLEPDENGQLMPKELPSEGDESLPLTNSPENSPEKTESIGETASPEKVESPDKVESPEKIKNPDETKQEDRAIDGGDDDIPEELTAPAAETDVELSSRSEGFSSNQKEIFEEAKTEIDSIEIADPSKTPPLNTELSEELPAKPGFLEQLRTKWSAFQKAQIESQSDTLQPAKAPISPSIQLYTDADEPSEEASREDVEYSGSEDEPANTAENQDRTTGSVDSADSERP